MINEHDQRDGSGVEPGSEQFPELMMFVCGEVDADAEDAWNKWYDEVHLPDVMDCPGFVRAVRYVKNDEDEPRTWVTLYELEGPEAFTTPEYQRARERGPLGGGPFAGKVRPVTTGLYRKHLCQ